jgi:PAS domain S-box-containing protein
MLTEWMEGGPEAVTQLQLFFEHAPIGLSWREVDENGRPGRNIVNKRFCELIGLSPLEASNIENVRQITHPDDWARQQALTAEIYAGKRDGFTLEKRYQRRDGTAVMCELTVVVLRDPLTSRVTHHFAMLGDVSARHAAEQELRRSESRWRTYLKIASEILYAITPEGVYKFVSDAWTPKLGHAVGDVVGRPYTEFVHPDDIPLLRDFIKETLELGVNPGGIEYRVQHKDGQWVWHATTGSAYTDRDGRRAFFGVGRDISIRRKAQEELKLALARREELEQIVNRSPSVVVLWLAEENWPVEYVSQSIRQFGYQPEDFTSRRLSFRGITHPDDRERVGVEVDAHAVNRDHEYNQEYRIVCADGSIRWVDDHTVVRFDKDGNVTHHEGLITDITPRKDAEDRERALRERDLRLAGEVQHQLRPHVFPDIGEVEIEALSQASLHIGGDYYDVLPVDEGRWGFVIADVAGKGPAAALMMAACRATLRLCAAGQPSAAAVVSRVNRALHADMPRGMFISLFYGILDLNTNRLTYVRAGHEPAILLRAGGGAPELLSAGGLALGFDEGPVFDAMLEEAVLDLAAGDLLALYTDGITEAANAAGEEFGRERMLAALAGQENIPLARVVEKLNRYLRQFSALASRNDDRTLLLVRTR